MNKIEVSARMTIRPGQLDGFKRQALEIIRQTREKDTKTLRYEWYLNSDSTACEVREAYESSEGLFEHRMHVGEGVSDFLCNLIQAGKRSPNMREKWASAWRQKIGGFQCTFAC